MTGPAAATLDPADARREDRRARRLAQREFTRPLLLEAGAGTGKTTTLVARVLAWCLGPGWRRHEAVLDERRRELGRDQPPAADEIASEVLERVVAITFTEDAAAEMARRAAGELGRLARPGGGADGDDPVPAWLHLEEDLDAAERARRAAALLATLDRLVVRTIHAFCRGLLADHPLEARLHPDLSVDADGLLLEEVARETVESNLRRLYGSADDSPYLALAGRGIGPRELVEALVVLSQAGLPADALDADPLAPARVARLRRRLADACAALCRLLPERGLTHNAGAVCAAVRELDARLGADGASPRPSAPDPFRVDTPPVEDLAGLLEAAADLLPRKLQDHLGKWAKSRLNKSEAAALGDRAEELAAAAAELRALLRHLDRLDPELLALAHRALAPLHRQVRDEMRARGIVTFEDLLAEAAHLLSDRADVAAGVRGRIDQLLVDEFQDTDALQCEIVARLGLEGPRERRPGLFLVGDPKQSIYGWRSADLAAYDRFRRRVQAAGGEVLPLVENFRSVPAILDEVERAVAPVMLAEPGYQPPFQPLLPCERLAGEAGFRTPGATDGGDAAAGPRRAAVEHWVPWRDDDGLPGAAERCGPATSKTHAYEVEAAALARDVRHLHDAHGVGWDRFAVLLRSTTDLDLYLEALRGHGVPFAVGRDKQYYRRREVIDAAALVRCVLDPGDHLALLTVLRSPWVGVPDAALVPLWNRGFPDLLHHLDGPDPRRLRELREVAAAAAGDLDDLAPGDVPGLARVAGWHLSLAAGCEQLALARRAFRELPADAFVDTLRRLFLLEPVAAARYLGAYRLANLERFFRRLVTALEEGGGDVTAVLRALRRSVAEAREAPEGKPREGAEDAVQVMTIHQAKGLDFGHVYLPQLHKDSGGADPSTEVQPALALPAADGGDGGDDGGDDGTGDDAADATFEVKLFGAPSLGFDRVEARRQRVEAAERVRLLYVAMTRAEHRLVLSGGWGEAAPEPREPERASHFLDLLAHRRDLPEPPPGERWAAREADFDDPAGALWRFPALTGWPEASAEEPSAADVPDPAEVTGASRRLEQRARRARGRMGRPFAATASEEAHHLLREALATGGSGVERESGEDHLDPWHREMEIGGGGGGTAPVAGDDERDRAGLAAAVAAAGGAEAGGSDDESASADRPRRDGETSDRRGTTEPRDETSPVTAGATPPAATSDDERRIALTVGTAVHRWLEELDLDDDAESEPVTEPGEPAMEPVDLAALVAAAVEPGLDEAGRATALVATEALVGTIRRGALLARLRDLAPNVLGREIPLLASPPEMSEDDAVDAAEAPGVPVPPVAYVSGAVDLLYRDPESGEIVVADYKTDAVEGDAVATRARLYAPQGRVYCDALQQALGLDHRPRFELWFLRADRVVEVDLDAARSGPAWSPGPVPRPGSAPATATKPAPTSPTTAPQLAPDAEPVPSKVGHATPGTVAEEPGPGEQIALFDLDGPPAAGTPE